MLQNPRVHTIGASATARPSCTRREALSVFALAMSAFAPFERISAHPIEPITEWSELNLPISHYLTLSVTVNGQTMPGVIDSGTTRSIIRHDIALDLALPYIGTELAETFTRQISGSLYRVDKLQVAGIDLGKVLVGAFDTSDLATRTHQNLPIIIGQDILSALDIEADFVGNRIRALSPKSPQIWPDHKSLTLYGTQNSFPSIRLALENQHHDDALVDFGNNVPMMMSASFARDAGLLKNRRTSTAMSAGIEGLALAEIFCLDTVRFGPFVLHGVPVQIIEEWEMALPIYIGWTFFRSFDAILSLAHQVMRLKADQAMLTADFPKDRSGLAAQRGNDRITIVHVARNSPGWAAGLRDNDVITQIDGQPVSASFPPPGMRMGFQPEGTLLQLGLANGRQIAFRLNDYF